MCLDFFFDDFIIRERQLQDEINCQFFLYERCIEFKRRRIICKERNRVLREENIQLMSMLFDVIIHE